MDAAFALAAALLLAVVALRRGRRVALSPRAGPPAVPGVASSRYRRVLTAGLAVLRVAIGLAALAGIAVLTGRLFG